VTCREGPCPSGLACVDMLCVVPVDASPDGMDGMDAQPPALTCDDPGPIALGDTVMGNTSAAMSFVSATCGGFSNVGREHIYKLDVPIGTQIMVTMPMGAQAAYVINQCEQFPSSCLGNARAVMGAGITVTTAVRPSFIVVDNATANAGGPYTLHVQ